MTDFASYLKFDTPPLVIFGSLFITCVAIGVILITRLGRPGVQRCVVRCILSEYVLLALCETVVFRRLMDGRFYHIDPFWIYKNLVDNPITGPWEIILNVAFFMPLGFGVGFLYSHINWRHACACGFCFSLLIETLQILFVRGYFETGDILHNTVGSLIGFLLYKILLKFLGGCGQISRHNTSASTLVCGSEQP
jgi:glycopeptide antibiotics resistance protein